MVVVAGVLLLGSVTGVAAAGQTSSSAATAGRTVLPSARLTFPPDDGEAPAADPSQRLSLRVYLAGQHPQDRVRAARAASTPDSPAYAHYLSPAQYGERFGATAAQSQRVRDWLAGQGMTVDTTTAHFVVVTATVAQINAAFATDLRIYRGTLAPAGDISVPSELGADIATVTGLNADAPGDRPLNRKQVTRTTSTKRAATADYPCSHWWGERSVTIPAAYGKTTAPTVLCGYSVAQMRAAYGITTSPYTGKGATVALILDNGSPTMEADANRFFADQGVPGFAPGQYREDFSPTFTTTCDRFQNPAPGEFVNTNRLEQAIDVESAHIFAPDATVVYVGADCGGNVQQNLLDAHFRVVDKHLADAASESFSITESGAFTPADIAAWDLMFQQGAIEGIGFTFDSGDDGDLGIGTPTEVTFPASDQWATGVGGTSLRLGAAGEVLGESGWGDNQVGIGANGYVDEDGAPATPPGQFSGGSGGGISTYLDQPDYQRGVVPAALATGGGKHAARRVVPDLAADAGLAWQIGFTGAKHAAGGYDVVPWGSGTSAASPLVAALAADAKQATGHALGFLNPALYRLAGTRALHDVLPVNPADPPIMAGPHDPTGQFTQPYLTTLGRDTSLTVTPGYDDVTGLGSPTTSFVNAFKKF